MSINRGDQLTMIAKADGTKQCEQPSAKSQKRIGTKFAGIEKQIAD